jgi:hypothetical protein
MTGPIIDAFRQWFGDQLKQGMSPRRVGDQVLAAIRDDRFYILTHPDWNPLIERRMQNILAGENPNPLPPPGAESLMQSWPHSSKTNARLGRKHSARFPGTVAFTGGIVSTPHASSPGLNET